MPHCVIDFSPDLMGDELAQKLTQACHGAMLQSGLFDPVSVKTRAHRAEAALTGQGDDSFIHVDIAIMPGRNSEQKLALMQAVADAIATADVVASSLTMEVRELVQAHYMKKLA